MAAILDPSLDWSLDGVVVRNRKSVVGDDGITKTLTQDSDYTFDQFRTRLLQDPSGLQEVRVDKTLDLTTLGALFLNVCTIPAGSKVKCAIIQILTLVVAGGTSVKVGLGTNGTSPSLLGKTSALTKNAQNGLVVADAASLIASQTNIDVCAVASGGAIGDTNISAGSVRVVIVYDTPAVLANV